MTDFAWRKDLSQAFGTITRPVASVYIKADDGQWHALTMLIDSGADASVMSRSFGELFGHNIKKGRKVPMKGFGEQVVIAYVHTMEIKIGEHVVKADVLVADSNKVPNVLGRKDVFDLFEIQFKNTSKTTRFIRK
jgi:predicted aspartyl protease